MANSTVPVGDSKVQLHVQPGVAQLQAKETATQLMTRAATRAQVVLEQPLVTV